MYFCYICGILTGGYEFENLSPCDWANIPFLENIIVKDVMDRYCGFILPNEKTTHIIYFKFNDKRDYIYCFECNNKIRKLIININAGLKPKSIQYFNKKLKN